MLIPMKRPAPWYGCFGVDESAKWVYIHVWYSFRVQRYNNFYRYTRRTLLTVWFSHPFIYDTLLRHAAKRGFATIPIHQQRNMVVWTRCGQCVDNYWYFAPYLWYSPLFRGIYTFDCGQRPLFCGNEMNKVPLPQIYAKWMARGGHKYREMLMQI